jgi:hypothetical protein
MFGRDWEPATAKIVAKKYHESDDVSGTWEYVADITPRSGSLSDDAEAAAVHVPRGAVE